MSFLHRITSTEAVNALETSQEEWGVGRKDREFRDKLVSETMGIIQDPPKRFEYQEKLQEDMKRLQQLEFPDDRSEALALYLQKKVEDYDENTYYEAEDSLGMDCDWPFYERTDRRTGRIRTETRRQFKDFNIKQLDPLKRFHLKTYSAEEWWYKLWNDEGCLHGDCLSALTVHHLLSSKIKCHSCGKAELLWNGGISDPIVGSWSDLICGNCHCSYKIKTKATEIGIQKCLKHGNVRDGMLHHFYEHPIQERKRFMLLVSREAGPEGYSVSIVEIKSALPRLVAESFIDLGEKRSKGETIKTTLTMKRDTFERHWCLIPQGEDDFQAAAIDIYDKIFGIGCWDEME